MATKRTPRHAAGAANPVDATRPTAPLPPLPPPGADHPTVMFRMPLETSTASRLDKLTSLRLLAALAVSAVHAGTLFRSTGIQHASAVGKVGVSFFFILSGFVLAWSFRPGTVARLFWWRRFSRIYPAYFVCWGLGLAVTYYINHGEPIRLSGATLLLVQSWFGNIATAFATNGVGWSLSDEAFFYALFPLAFVAIARLSHRNRWLACGAVLVVLVLLTALGAPTGFGYWLVFVAPPVRLCEFLIGIVIAVQMKSGWRPPIGVAVTAALLVLGGAAALVVPSPWRLTLITLIPFSVVIAVAAKQDLDGRRGILNRAWAVRLGEWSFAFYLVHQLVFRLLQQHFGVLGTGKAAAISVLGILISTACAGALHEWVEKPVERTLRRAYRGP